MKRSLSQETLETAPEIVQEVVKKSRVDNTEIIFLQEHSTIPTNVNGTNGGTNGDTNGITNKEEPAQNGNGFGHNLEEHQNGVSDSHCAGSTVDNDPWFSDEGEKAEIMMTEGNVTPNDKNETQQSEVPSETQAEELKEIIVEPSDETDNPILTPAELEMGASCSKSEGWDQRKFETFALTSGHTDLITAIAVDGNIAVTASSDTTLKAWDLKERHEICHLGGHKGAVMAVVLLSKMASLELLQALGETETSGQVIISGAQDCYIKLWLVPTGRLLRSIYTYNNVWQVGYSEELKLVVTGTDAGKLEMFDPISGKTLGSEQAFDQPVVALKVSGEMVVCGNTHAQLQVWKIKDRKLNCLKSTNAVESCRRSLTGLQLTPSGVVTGHITGSVKTVSWNTGAAKRFSCADNKGKVTDVAVCGEILIATTSENESSALHFYELPNVKYLGSMQAEGKVMCVGASRLTSGLRIVAAGQQLRVWETSSNQGDVDDNSACVTLWSRPDDTETDSEEEIDDAEVVLNQNSSSSRQWCSIV